MEWERIRSSTSGLIRSWFGNIVSQPEFRVTVLAALIWLLWVEQFQPWRYSSSGYRPPSLIDVIGFFFWRIGFNSTHDGALASGAGVLSIASLIYLAGWVFRSFGNPTSRSGGGPQGRDSEAGPQQTQRKGASVEKSSKSDFSWSEGWPGGPGDPSSVRCQPATRRHWSDLPLGAQQRLLSRQSAGSVADQFRFPVGRRTGVWITLACFSVWLYLLGKVGWEHLASPFAVTFVATACCVFCTMRTFGRKVPGLRPHLTSCFYSTRLYFIRTDFDDVWFWPSMELQSLHYDGREILTFEFADWTYRTRMRRAAAAKFKANFDEWQRDNKSAVAHRDIEYILANDDFVDLRARGPFTSTSTRLRRFPRLLAEVAVSVFIGFVVVREFQDVSSGHLGAATEATAGVLRSDGSTEGPFSASITDGTQGTKTPSSQSAPERSSPLAAAESSGGSPGNPDPCQSADLSLGPRRPFNGAHLGGEPSANWHCKLRISNGNPEDAAVLVANATSETSDRLVYVRAGMIATLNRIAPGQYRVTFQLGTAWDAQAESFRCASATTTFDRLASFEERETDKGVEYSTVAITLHKLAGGNAQTSPVASTVFRRRGKTG